MKMERFADIVLITTDGDKCSYSKYMIMKKGLPDFAKAALGEDLSGRESEVHIGMSSNVLDIYMADDEDDYNDAINTKSVAELIEYCKSKGVCDILTQACFEFNIDCFQAYYDKLIEAFPQLTGDEYKGTVLGDDIVQKMQDGMHGVSTDIFEHASAGLLLMYLHNENNFGADKAKALYYHLYYKPKNEWPRNIEALILTYIDDKELLFKCAKICGKK